MSLAPGSLGLNVLLLWLLAGACMLWQFGLSEKEVLAKHPDLQQRWNASMIFRLELCMTLVGLGLLGWLVWLAAFLRGRDQ